VVRLLLAHGADAMLCTAGKNTAAHIALERGHGKVATLLVRYMKNVLCLGAGGRTLLHLVLHLNLHGRLGTQAGEIISAVLGSPTLTHAARADLITSVGGAITPFAALPASRGMHNQRLSYEHYAALFVDFGAGARELWQDPKCILTPQGSLRGLTKLNS
jgi:hypothetical protein